LTGERGRAFKKLLPPLFRWSPENRPEDSSNRWDSLASELSDVTKEGAKRVQLTFSGSADILVSIQRKSEPPDVGCYEVGGGGAREYFTALLKKGASIPSLRSSRRQEALVYED
jgi:hypothetical protein